MNDTMNGAALLCLPCPHGLKVLETISPNKPVDSYLFLLQFCQNNQYNLYIYQKRVLGNYTLHFLSLVNIISCYLYHVISIMK